MDSSNTRPIWAIALQLVRAVTLVAVVLFALPSRVSWIDLPALTLAGLNLAAALTLLFKRAIGKRLGMLAAQANLFVGCILVALLLASCAWLWGIHGPMGQGGAVLFGSVVLLVLPYLVFAPILELRSLRKSVANP
jgi:hypothetical protein